MEVMLDLETMGTGSNAAITAIGAVTFDEIGIQREFYSEVNLQSSVDNGGVIDGKTVMWWLKQSNEARTAFKNNDDAPLLPVVLMEFSYWYSRASGTLVWGNGTAFDNVILRNAYNNCGLTAPWDFLNDRCYRTIKAMYKGIPFERVGTYHNALDDARSQALHLLKIREV